MKSYNYLIAIFIGIFGIVNGFAANLHWKNSGTDMLSAASYDENKVPTADDVIYFDEPMVKQPYLSNDLTVKGLFFGLDNGTRTTEATDPDGYIFTGAEGKKLTLTLSGNNTYVINSLTTSGTVIFRVPIVFSAGTSTQRPAANGITLVFEAAVSTANDNYEQDIETVCDGSDANHNGKIIFAAANPDFKPKRIHIGGCTCIEVRHPQALENVKEISTGHWGGHSYPTLINNCGEPLVLDNLVYFARESSGLNAFYFEGEPFIITNCVLSYSMRDDKPRYINTYVKAKRIQAEDYSGRTFQKAGNNVLELLEATQEVNNNTNHLYISEGLLYAHDIAGIAFRPYRRCVIGVGASSGTSFTPGTLGLTTDTQCKVGDLAVCFRKYNAWGSATIECTGGFSAISGNISLSIVDENGSLLSPWISCEAITDSEFWRAPRYLAFGHPAANGTILLMNDYQSSSADRIYALQGGSKVAVRFKGNYTIPSGQNFQKYGNGVASFDKSFLTCPSFPGYVREGGLLMNCEDSQSEWTVENGSWLGGKGLITSVSLKSGGLLRAGEDGMGELTVLGTVKTSSIANGCGIFVEVGYNGGAACLVFKGGTNQIGFTAEPGSKVFVDGDVNKFAPGRMRVKIMDWSNISDQVPAAKQTMFNIENYEVVIVDSHKFKKAWLEKDEEEKAIYLVYVRPTEGFSMVFRP